MTKRTRRVVIDDCTYRDGKLSSKKLVDYCKKKTDAELIRKQYKVGRISNVFGVKFKPVRGQ